MFVPHPIYGLDKGHVYCNKNSVQDLYTYWNSKNICHHVCKNYIHVTSMHNAKIWNTCVEYDISTYL